MKSYRLKKEGMVLLTTSIKWFLLITVLLSSGCSEGHRVPSGTLSLPQQGDIINELFNIGDTLPSFTAIDSEGAPYVVDGSKYGDRYTMIVFWRGDPTSTPTPFMPDMMFWVRSGTRRSWASLPVSRAAMASLTTWI